MNGISFKTQMTTEVDIDIADWSKVNQYCESQGNTFQSLDEFAERLSCEFWKAVPEHNEDGARIRHLEIGYFVEASDGYTHNLSPQHTDLFGEITLTISKEFDSEKVEKTS